MANYNREKKAFMGAGISNLSRPSLPPISGSTPAPPDYSGGWLGKMMGMSGPSTGATTQGMQLDRQNGTDTASRQKAIQAAIPSNLPAPTQPDYSGGWLGKMMGMSGPSTGATTQGMQLDRQNGTDTMSRRKAQLQAGTNVGGGAPIGTMGEAAGTNAGGGLPEGVKQSMDKQAIAFHANRLHILNTELAKYTPAVLLKQAADYPTTRNKQACAYYLGLKKQAAIEKKALFSLIGQGIAGAGRLLAAPFGAVARGHMANAGKAALRGVEIATKKAPIASLAGFGGLTLGAEHFGLPFLGDVADATKARYNDTEKGIGNFFHRLGRGYNATTADPTSDFASDGINKAKKVIESVTPKAVTNSGIIPSKPSRLLEVEEGSIPDDFKSRSLPRDNPQWRSGTRGRDYPRY